MSIDISKEWSDLLPEKFMDKRSSLPTNPRFKWKKRVLSDIKGICIHQTLGGDNPIATANYHTKNFNNGSSTPGAPGICYTLYVRRNGEVWWCNDVESITWSQGTSKIPGDENKSYLSVVVGGNFNGPGYSGGKEEPSFAQLFSVMEIIKWLSFHLGLNAEDIKGHHNFGKIACPGYTLMSIIEAVNKDTSMGFVEWSDVDWQYNLVRLGYDLGKFGPDKDGVDGSWGPSSKNALLKFQKDNKISESGVKDIASKEVIIKTLKEKFGTEVSLIKS